MGSFPDLFFSLQCLSEIFQALNGWNQGLCFKPVNGELKRMKPERF